MLTVKYAPRATFCDSLEQAVEAEVWRDGEGVPCAYGRLTECGLRLVVPQTGVFELDAERREITVQSGAAATPSLIQDTVYRVVYPLALQALGCEVLHASAVHTSRGVVALAARSGTGKSTLAHVLAQSSKCTLWADDAVVFDLTGSRVRAAPVPFRLRLLPDAAQRFPAADAGPAVDPSAVELAAIVLLERSREAEGGLAIVRLPPLQAFQQLLPHAYAFSLREAERRTQMVGHYVRIASEVPIYQVSIPHGLEQLPRVAKRLRDELVLRGCDPDLAIRP